MLPTAYDLSLYTNYSEMLKFLVNRFEQIGLDKESPTVEISRTDAKCISDVAQIFMNSTEPGSLKAAVFKRAIDASADGSYTAETTFSFSAETMVSAYNGAEKTIHFLSSHKSRTFSDTLMKVHQFNESFDGEKGDQVIIPEISDAPLRVTFASIEGDYLKSHLLNDPMNPFKQAFSASGIVSLDLDGKPAAYHITSLKKLTS